ncbi:hypothetical protein FAGAP_10004 [Fusarium agapanthi]|uniref:Uncharacterized protein n=1 Tax=Fusarium agapanthi TaxID=1803897 RepID=A0A9P5B2R0_9HYPO|nr:hypothetical protein FAGAP_10004 [Fusarium agapanthi]
MVLEVLSVASTLWPILFAAVLGPLLKSIALFRAERGSKLGSLEFLLTSQTTASALKNILTMGWIGSWAIGVIAIWSLSPLGGQAALRSFGLQQNPVSTKTPATYYLGDNRSQVFPYYRDGASVFFGASAGTSLISDMRTILSTSFSTQDILVSHANTSSPYYNDTIADLGGYDGEDPHAWVSVPEDEVVPYASLIGLPIRGGSFERPGNSSMTAHFHYQTLSCGNAFNGSEWVRNGSTALWYHNTKSSVPLRYHYMGEEAPDMGYPNIWFDFPNTSTLAEHFSATFDMEPQSKLQLVMGGILRELPFTGVSHHVAEPSTLEMYLRDPLGVFQRILGGYKDDPETTNVLGCFTSLPPKIIEKRLVTVLNTITMSTYEENVLTGVLMICAIANIVVRQHIKAPDFLDSVAGLTRDSPFVDVPQEGSGKSGSDRLEAIKNVKVRISDVNSDEEVGKIALTTELNDPKLRWERVFA